MTEKERREVFNDPDSWTPSVEFPSNGLIRVMVLDFYGLAIYDLQMYKQVFDYSSIGLRPRYHPGFESRLYFIRNGACLEEVSKTRCYELMKEEERREMA